MLKTQELRIIIFRAHKTANVVFKILQNLEHVILVPNKYTVG